MQQGIANSADGELILKLYELRTETVMRQARRWITVEFWPATAAEFFAIQNGWIREINAVLFNMPDAMPTGWPTTDYGPGKASAE